MLAVSPDADNHLKSKLTGMIRDWFEAPEWKGLLVPIDPRAPQPSKKPDYVALAETGAKAMLGTTYAQVDAATLIFYHPILDGVAFDCLRVTALQAPSDWEKELSGMQVGLLEARDEPYELLLRVKINKRLADLDRESLLTKVHKLFTRCKPEPNCSPMHGYAYDQERIDQFDDQRHEIVHGAAVRQTAHVVPGYRRKPFLPIADGHVLCCADQHAVRAANRPPSLEHGSPRPG